MLQTDGYGVAAGSAFRLSTVMTGIGIKCWDTFDNSTNRCGVYSIEMVVDSADRCTASLPTAFHSVNQDISTVTSTTGPGSLTMNTFTKLFIQPGNRLSMYDTVASTGVY
ncbi:MAG: hypothetical protein MZV63_08585 [Marinilabiliales bacterium]|nr:hypothetical protein [Marinilabiliales bacterium]